jgi:16S rRNA G527 N7-methylase RsmG
LKTLQVESVVARAVGPVSRIYTWLRPCSTWNHLILLKGPGWPDEWAEFQKTSRRRELVIEREFGYSVGPEHKQRRILRLQRVRR